MNSTSSRSFVWIAWGLVYVAAAAGIVWSAWQGRKSAIARYDSASGEAEWREWKDAAQQMSEQGGPLARRPPKGNEIPALVLLRDHFGVCVAAMLFAFSALYAVLAVLVTGAMRTSSVPARPLTDAEERRQRGV